MLNCKYYPINEHVFFYTAVSEKQSHFRILLENVSNRVLTSYDNYLNNFPIICTQTLSEFDLKTEKDEMDALQLCYSSATKSFKYFKAKIITDQPPALKTLCPYCMIDQPKTLDHYVGQSEFPEFSILTKNLVPCCWNCNNVKRSGWRTAGIRNYINFYDDQFLVYPFLNADLILVPGSIAPSIEYKLSRPQEISEADYSIIKSHFSALDLLQQYNEKANSRLSTEIETVKCYIREGFNDATINRLLLSRFLEFTNDFGINYWEAIIYKTIASELAMIRAI